MKKYGLRQTVAPTESPVSLDEQKAHSGIFVTDADDYLTARIKAATKYFQDGTAMQLVTATWELTLDDCFPRVIWVPRSPLQSVTSIQYVDTAGVTQTLDASAYTVDTKQRPGRIVPAYGKCWPVTQHDINAVTVTFVAGFGAAAATPDDIKGYIMALVEHWYTARSIEDTTIGGNVHIPATFDQLLTNNWVGTY